MSIAADPLFVAAEVQWRTRQLSGAATRPADGAPPAPRPRRRRGASAPPPRPAGRSTHRVDPDRRDSQPGWTSGLARRSAPVDVGPLRHNRRRGSGRCGAGAASSGATPRLARLADAARALDEADAGARGWCCSPAMPASARRACWPRPPSRARARGLDGPRRPLPGRGRAVAAIPAVQRDARPARDRGPARAVERILTGAPPPGGPVPEPAATDRPPRPRRSTPSTGPTSSRRSHAAFEDLARPSARCCSSSRTSTGPTSPRATC